MLIVQITLKQQEVNADIANDNNFKSFKYKVKLLANI